MSNLIQAAELQGIAGQENVRIIDVRFALNDPKKGRSLYQEGHIPNALFLDLDEDLSVPPSEHGGRHPLPDMQAFAKKLGRLGISEKHHVVIYDDAAAVFAGRLWFMLRLLGHKKVQVLDGGLRAWLAEANDLSQDIPAFEAVDYTAVLRDDMLVDAEYISRNLDNPNVLLIDARGKERYRGDSEPLDKKAGHIPSALNMPYTDNLKDGKYKASNELKERFSDVKDAEEIIVYCGSGVSANHNLIALEEAGIKGAKLYVGSWSDWSSYDNKPVATGDEHDQ